MDIHERVQNAEQHSLELHASFSDIEHRSREFEQTLSILSTLREQLAQLNTDISQLRSNISGVQAAMQAVARKEELKRFEDQLDAIPFERLATQKDVKNHG